MKKLVLFDVDKTLIESSQGHSSSFSYAFNEVYGIDANINIINHHGMTDQQIIIDVLKKKGLEEKEIKQKIDKCTLLMAEYFNSITDYIDIKVLEGVYELLEELKKRDYILGLVTGNIEPIARKKLKIVGLEDYFKVGGFGSDDIKRTNLIKIAIKKAEELNFKFNKNNAYLIGDTPLDIEAGKEVGIITIGVSTGIYSKEDLEKALADYVVDNLKNKYNITKILE